MQWHARNYSTTEAASAAGINSFKLDKWGCRYRDYFPHKIGGRRMYSAADVAMVATANALSAAGLPLLDGLRDARALLRRQPDPDARLVAVDGVLMLATPADASGLRDAASATTIDVPIGAIVASVIERLAEI